MADIYIRHDCDVVIDVNGCAKVFVTVYDRANVKVRQGGMGRVYVYKNGDSCIVETEGSVTMQGKEKRSHQASLFCFVFKNYSKNLLQIRSRIFLAPRRSPCKGYCRVIIEIVYLPAPICHSPQHRFSVFIAFSCAVNM